jgi:hypothetical protein
MVDSLASHVSTGFLPGLEGPVDRPFTSPWTPQWTPDPNSRSGWTPMPLPGT